MCKKTIRFRNYREKWIIRPYQSNFFELGFSLVELIVIITLSSILLTLAFPVYNHLILDLRLFSLTDRVLSTLNYAQSEAIRRQSVITLCKSKDGKSCSGSWRDGWIILKNNNSTSSTRNLLRVFPALRSLEFLEWHGFHSDNYLQLFPDGSIQNGHFILCVNILSKRLSRFIKISPTGRIRIEGEIHKGQACNS